MALDIVNGDFLTIGSTDYPIKAAEVWTQSGLNSRSFSRLASVSCSTKRATAATDAEAGMKKRGAASENLAGLSCLPFQPVSADLAETLGLKSPHQLKKTFIADGDGFVLVVVEVKV